MIQPRRRWVFPTFALACLFLSHLPFVALPFFWDELGQFVPASLDLYEHGAWVPETTLPNVHPPGLMAYLAAVWALVGYSIPVTRLALLVLAALSLGAVWLLGQALEVPQGPRRLAIGLLLASPLFYTQAMMVQLELPALLFTALALALFLQGRYGLAMVACTALVLMKETGALVPLLLAGWSAREGNYRRGVLFLVPLAAVAAWLLVLKTHTGDVFGNREFAQYNLFYPLHPVRLAASLVRRAYYLFGSSFHWIGTVALLTAPAVLKGRSWKLTVSFLGLHAVQVSVLGGATLERYLLPVLPVLYLAMASACWRKPWLWRASLLGGLLASLWINPLYPFPFENNLAFTDFVRLQQSAAAYLERNRLADSTTTAWPFTDALRRPAFGYVAEPHTVRAIEDFRKAEVSRVATPVLVLYTRTWKSPVSVLDWPAAATFLRRFYHYEPAVTQFEWQAQGWREEVRFERRSQVLTILRRAGTH